MQQERTRSSTQQKLTNLQGASDFVVSRVLFFRLSGWNLLTNTYLLVGKGLDGKLLTCGSQKVDQEPAASYAMHCMSSVRLQQWQGLVMTDRHCN